MDDENRMNETATLPDKPWQVQSGDSEMVSTPVKASVKEEVEEEPAGLFRNSSEKNGEG